MKMDIDSILKPYADEQPDRVNIQSNDKHCIIERIPPIVDMNGVTDEFQSFFDIVVDCVTTRNYNKLYEYSDKVLSQEQFIQLCNRTIDSHLECVLSLPVSNRGVDIELNLNRFKQIHRNLIGGFLVITYKLTDCDFDCIDLDEFEFEQKYSEILFTYKQNRFVVLSNLTPFKSVD